AVRVARAGRAERPGRGHAQRRLLAGRAALRAAHRLDAVQQGALQPGGLRRDPPHHPRGRAHEAEHEAEHGGGADGPGPQPGDGGREGGGGGGGGGWRGRKWRAGSRPRPRRYETASAFAADVQRHLDDEPVQACPPSAWYRLRKFARRNKAGLAVAGFVLFVVALLGGVGGWGARDRESREDRAVSQAEAARADAERVPRA